jgi:hypothetical protein
MFFASKPKLTSSPINRRAEARDAFVKAISAAVGAAQSAHVGVRELADVLDEKAQQLRVSFATTAPLY